MAERESMQAEAAAFDAQIEERVRHGHVPDIRHCGRCEWFRNNPWRDAGFVDLVYGDRFRWLDARLPSPRRILEVGCGPGYMALELARAGHDVLGIDVSASALEIARKTADESPPQSGRVTYSVQDFLAKWDESEFDAVLFNNALHHFSSQHDVMNRVREVLRSGGDIFVMEPCRERLDEKGAAVWLLVESLLAVCDGYVEPVPLLRDGDSLGDVLSAYISRGRYENERGGPVQSPHDLAAGYEQMTTALRSSFLQREEEWEGAFYANVIGGLRLSSREDEVRLASLIKRIDRFLVEAGCLPAVGFRWHGRNGMEG